MISRKCETCDGEKMVRANFTNDKGQYTFHKEPCPDCLVKTYTESEHQKAVNQEVVKVIGSICREFVERVADGEKFNVFSFIEYTDELKQRYEVKG